MAKQVYSSITYLYVACNSIALHYRKNHYITYKSAYLVIYLLTLFLSKLTEAALSANHRKVPFTELFPAAHRHYNILKKERSKKVFGVRS